MNTDTRLRNDALAEPHRDAAIGSTDADVKAQATAWSTPDLAMVVNNLLVEP